MFCSSLLVFCGHSLCFQTKEDATVKEHFEQLQVITGLIARNADL